SGSFGPAKCLIARPLAQGAEDRAAVGRELMTSDVVDRTARRNDSFHARCFGPAKELLAAGVMTDADKHRTVGAHAAAFEQTLIETYKPLNHHHTRNRGPSKDVGADRSDRSSESDHA